MAATTSVVLLATSVALAAISAGVGAYSAVSAANAREDAAKYNQAVAKNNARTAREQANFEADRIRDRNRRFAAKQRNAIIGSGFVLSGTGQDIVADSATQGELDVLSVLYTGDIASMNQKARAKLFGMEASAARREGTLGMVSSIVGGASDSLGAYTNPNLNPNFKP